MGEYRLTTKGKIVAGILMILLAWGAFSSAAYIVKYASNALNSPEMAATDPSVSTDETTTMGTEPQTESTTTETGSQVETEATSEVASAETTESDEHIYSSEDLSILSDTRAIIYFSEGASTYDDKGSNAALEEILKVMAAYPDEPLAISGYVNGYPTFNQRADAKSLSKARAESVLQFFLDKGIDKSRINVYNFGSEAPATRQRSKQWQNDRVEVYFENHYAAVPGK